MNKLKIISLVWLVIALVCCASSYILKYCCQQKGSVVPDVLLGIFDVLMIIWLIFFRKNLYGKQ